MKIKSKPNYKLLIIIAVFIAGIVLICNSGLIVNTTDSIPVGLYYKKSTPLNIKRGDIVIVQLPDEIQSFGAERKYIYSKKTKVTKRVIAVPGDDVFLTSENIIVNGKKYKAPLHLYDSKHHSIVHIKRGKYYNTSGYWLYGYNDPDNSWDSRYYGPVKKCCIKGTAISLITF